MDKHAKQDKRVDKANWVAVFLLGQEAESMSRHLSKDSHVNVHGRLIQRTWVTKDGHQHSRLEVIADDIDLTTSSQRQEEPQTQTHNHDHIQHSTLTRAGAIKMSQILNDGSYIVVQAWMLNKLRLKGTELMAYAVVYSFSQDGSSWFSGSASYIAAWAGVTPQSARRALKSLTERGLLEKRVRTENGTTACDYRAIINHPGGTVKTTGG